MKTDEQATNRMARYREERGSCLIEAGALDLDSSHWQPWVRLTRPAGGVSASCTLDRLKPVFGTEQAALRYAAELGRNLADEGWGLDAAPQDRKAATWSLRQAFKRSCTDRIRKSALAQGRRTATYMVRALARIFARVESHGDGKRESRIELYLGAATEHAELERRMRETDRSAVSIAVTFSH